MFNLSAYSQFYNDKIIEHPRLGSVSCSGLMENYQNCETLLQEYKWKQTCSYFKELCTLGFNSDAVLPTQRKGLC
jgi:hypothetical protein